MTTKSAEGLAEEWAYKNNAADWGTLVGPVSGAIEAFLAGRESMREELQELVNKQAEDPGLWFDAQTAPEAYLQQELRKLHAAIELEAEK